MEDNLELIKQDEIVYLYDLLFFIKGLSSSQKVLLLFLGKSSNNEGYSLNHLSDICGVTKQTTIKNLKFLEWLSWIEINRQKNKFCGNETNRYLLKIENIKKTIEFCKDKNIKLNALEKEYKDLKK